MSTSIQISARARFLIFTIGAAIALASVLIAAAVIRVLADGGAEPDVEAGLPRTEQIYLGAPMLMPDETLESTSRDLQ